MTIENLREAEAKTAEAVGAAARAGRSLEIVGGGAHRTWGAPVAADATLSTAAMSGIALYEPGELTLIAGAGTPMPRLGEILAKAGQRLAFEPPDWSALLGTKGAVTLGGVTACGLSGPRRVLSGSCRDQLLGLRFIDGRGRIHRAGGRVMKNVTGFDTTRLVAGSGGSLGVIAEIAVKTQPIPESEITLSIEGLDEAQALAALAAALASPWEVSGAAHLPAGLGAERARTLLRIEGLSFMTQRRAPELIRLLKPFGAANPLAPEAGPSVWREIRDAAFFAGKPGAVWRVALDPAHALEAARIARGLGGEAFYDWGGGLVWALIPEEGEAGAGHLRRLTAATGGKATLIRGSDALKARVPPFEPLSIPVMEVVARLKAAFDPNGILNPGRMGAMR